MRPALVLLLCLWASVPLLAQETRSEEPADPSTWDEVVRLYERAKEAGEQVPKDVYEWAREDLQSAGDWEYRVVEYDVTDAATLEGRLNALGEERWECIWVRSAGDKTQFVLKRPSRTYLRNIPLSQLLKLIPGSTGGEE